LSEYLTTVFAQRYCPALTVGIVVDHVPVGVTVPEVEV
jgi:hypothetical protein